ncbi:unnamed protein product (macronuclear) [Paramecium tetraurelia]|uniref:TAFII55 protein conserved region domain-containing protein n=1 Tax=Paramecium tetraurelia TaxID=5888 RepID=A0DUM8_PARTE|nr:uncharacterized protein GSPATT00020417001 [Paramecium tetraurelia]CAK86745.1 unnamed protein product [Paramecium tetraurelia]|eukprot:XP_001454142.1 hypothetical protein (macronuclear) [Paramecium tetraurelia strain d4-2]
MNKLPYQPLGFVLKFDPPIIGLLYHPIENKKVNKKKKKCYAIHLNNLIFLVEPEDIVEALFNEHQEFLDPDVVKPQQVYKLVLRLVAYRDHQLRNMQEMGEEMGDGYYEEEEEEPVQQPKGKGGKAQAQQRRANDNNRSF